VDRAATLAVQARNARRTASIPPPLGAPQRATILKGFAALYPETLGDDFFLPVRAITPVARAAPNELGVEQALDLSWDSAYQPFLAELRERYARTTQNQHAAVRLLSARASVREKRPVALLIHGYMTGHYHVEQRLWPLGRVLRSGHDVALFTLPFHGMRANPLRRGPPEFPGADPRFSNEGFRQVIGDLRNFVHWLKEQGHPAVGVMGMSLGGYTAALLAFPVNWGTLRPYGGVGISLNLIQHATVPSSEVIDEDQQDVVANAIHDERDRAAFIIMGGLQAQYRRFSVFGQATFMPARANFFFSGRSTYILEAGLRYNVGSSIDKTP